MLCRTFDAQIPEERADMFNMLAERRRLSLGGDQEVETKTRGILEEVRTDGLGAVMKYTRLYDAPDFTPRMFHLDRDFLLRMAEATCCADLDPILEAAENIRAFHQEQKEKSWFIRRPDGSVLGQVMHPVRRAGLYVPGGKGGETPLISSLLMTAIPAMVAGVREIVVVTPPRPDGSVNPLIMAAAGLLGISELYACGSAWAIGALTYGAGPLAPVDVIAGPGNIWVSTAKRLVAGQVGIDMVAGPSEIVIVADQSADPIWLAADMLSQAEHDPLASAICLVTEAELVPRLLAELEGQCAALPRAALAAESLQRWGAVALAPNLEQACALAGEIAPEHLELMCENPWELLPQVRAAGSVFMGRCSSEALGDYYAGPNHVLPTMGTARFSSGLGVHTFTTRSNVICATTAAASLAAAAVARLARLEGLEAHARAAELRTGMNKTHN
ncbi:MAG: histidinol dehydrogenase [Deltaproteobacteria bacterium]|jgi:histidinol dehydrogenase|nr:histidinol dehydrogenase [Deltaproteobacteria bacterium]